MRRALAFLCLFALAACTGSELNESDAMFRVSDDSGSLVIPVRTVSSSGTRYRLENATFEVSGTAMVTLSNSGGEASSATLSTPLPSGSYQVFLRPGYELVMQNGDGTEQRVNARLSSENPMRVQIGARRDRAVTLSFQREGGVIAFGPGAAQPMAERAAPAAVLARAP